MLGEVFLVTVKSTDFCFWKFFFEKHLNALYGYANPGKLMSIAPWANIRNFLCGMTMMAEEEIFGMCVQRHGNIAMSAFPSMRTITTNIRFVGSSTIEIDENIVCCLS
jgi:hypothetical protein